MSKLGWFLGGCVVGVAGLMATAAVCAYSEDNDVFTNAMSERTDDDDEACTANASDSTTLASEESSSMETNTPCGPLVPTMS